jgi:uncharacterized protein (DUF1697 family)
MAALRELCGELGWPAETYIASGNVIFRERAPQAAALEAAIADRFGVDTTVVLRTAAQLKTLTANPPFGARAENVFVAFLARKPARAAFEAFSTTDFPEVAWQRVGPDLALEYRTGFGRAWLTVGRLEKLLGVEATLRNWRTATKLAELAAG